MPARVFQHLGLKTLSIALALLLWFMVAGQKEAERALRIPLEFQNIPGHLELIGEPPSVVDVRVKGASGALAQLRSPDLVALVDLAGARPGRRMFHLTGQNVSVPTGVRVISVLPATIGLTFEAAATRTVPVVPAIDGEPAAGFVIGQVTAAPPTVDVVGPESVVRQLTEATTEPVSVAGAASRVRDRVTIGLASTNARLQVPGSALVTVEILPAPVSRTVADVPVILRNLARRRSAHVNPRTISVTARGPAATLDRLAPQRIPVFVDLSGLAPGRYNLPVRIDPTGEFTVTAVEPAGVSVRIR